MHLHSLFYFMSATDLALLIISGGLGGLLAGFLGVGGGIIFVLIFSHYLLKSTMPVALVVPAIVANSMFAIFFAGISGSIKQYNNKNFFFKPIISTAIPAVICSIGMTWFIQAGTWYTKERFAIFFIALLIYMAWRTLKGKETEVNATKESDSRLQFIFIGSLSGFIAALSGIGGGVIMVPFFMAYMGMSIKKATGVSLGVITLMALFTSLFSMFLDNRSPDHHTLGLIVPALALPVALGSVFFAPLGVSLAAKASPKLIRSVFGIFLLLVIAKMFYSLLG